MERLGVIVRGSLARGLEMRLDPGVPQEELRAGMFAVAAGKRYDFLCMLTDLELGAVTEDALNTPPRRDSLLHRVLAGEGVYTRVMLRPYLAVDRRSKSGEDGVLPVKTIPAHFTEVRRAEASDVERVFGGKSQPKFFHIGAPIEMEEIPVCLNLRRLVERSSGIFGKTGTGKTFLTRMLLCGLVQSGAAVTLIFDMHGEYGWQGTDEQQAGKVTKGLQQLFPERVQVFTLDPQSSYRCDAEIQIRYSDLEPEDILSLHRAIGLTPTAAETSYLLYQRYEKQWFEMALTRSAKELAEEVGAHAEAMGALRRKLVRLHEQCAAFLKPGRKPDKPDGRVPDEPDIAERILQNLQRGIHTVIHFGRFDDPVHYLLVANVLTRRIDRKWREKTEQFLSNPSHGAEPPPVVIVIEEAHKFLEPAIADQTIFGRIARELRKYSVTLLIVDQRPSRIAPEVLSQIGTKICCLLDDEADVQAVLAGTSGSTALRSVLASLDTRQQALLFGHALPMPVVVRTRKYDRSFWDSVGHRSEAELQAEAKRDAERLYSE